MYQTKGQGIKNEEKKKHKLNNDKNSENKTHKFSQCISCFFSFFVHAIDQFQPEPHDFIILPLIT